MLWYPSPIAALSTFMLVATTKQAVISDPTRSCNKIPFNTRAHWMRRANAALVDRTGSICPFYPFGTVIVNHTDTSGLGKEVCIGANRIAEEGNPTKHGEIAAINSCTTVLTDPNGEYRYTNEEARSAFRQLSLYTNAEPCTMCASAIRLSGFHEYIYGTSIDTLIVEGWNQIRIQSIDVVQQSFDLSSQSRLVGNVLNNETDVLFSWQYNPEAACPEGCARDENGSCRSE